MVCCKRAELCSDHSSPAGKGCGEAPLLCEPRPERCGRPSGPGSRATGREGPGPAADSPARSPHGGHRGTERSRGCAAVAAVLSRPGSEEGDATRWRLTEGLFVTNAPGDSFPRAGTGSQPELFLLRNGVILSRWFPANPSQPSSCSLLHLAILLS